MPLKGTADPIGRTFKIIRLFASRTDGVTINDIRKELGVSDSVARYYLDHASIHMPIFKDGTRDTDMGQKPFVFKLIKRNEAWSGKEIL